MQASSTPGDVYADMNSAAYYARCPGIPIGITSRARIGMKSWVDDAGPGYSYIYDNSAPAYCLPEVTPDYGVGGVFTQQYGTIGGAFPTNIGAGSRWVVTVGDVTVSPLSVGGTVYYCFDYAADGEIELCLLGFYWDRFSAPTQRPWGNGT
jgi:hypothetical protein